MRISAIELNNFRCFPSANVGLSKGINLIIGSNNSGKSTLLKSVAWIQQGATVSSNDLRILQNSGYVEINFSNFPRDFFPTLKQFAGSLESISSCYLKVVIFKDKVSIFFSFPDSNSGSLHQEELVITNSPYSYSLPNIMPMNFIFPYLSKRKVSDYSQTINLQTTNAVTGNFSNLYAKIDRLSNPQLPSHKKYIEACEDILGFPITTTSSDHGKQAAYLISDYGNISMESMGEGIPNLIGLIVDLCMAENKIFLIEEPENDVHPQALKKLLNLISEKSETNQFIITTHSNIVVKHLGAKPESKLFRVKMVFDEKKVPTSTVEEVGNSIEARLETLEELGYEFIDFDIWSGWLILEESSAEKIIREYLIPWFTPELKGRLRTFSARSLSEVMNKFEAFNNLFVFLHLQPIYKNLAWVVIDAGDDEKKVIEKLKDRYIASGWKEENFLQFNEHDFEQYYPIQFKSKIEVIFSKDKTSRRESKKALLNEVENWIKENPKLAKEAFEQSAANVIEILRRIKSILLPEGATLTGYEDVSITRECNQ